MARHNISLAIILLSLFAMVIFAMQSVLSSEVGGTTMLYLLEDATTDHGEKNLMLGSSSIKRLESQEFLECGPWLNRGIGNSTISSLDHYLGWSRLIIDPAMVMLYAGENDISFGASTDEVFKNYKLLLQKLVDKFPTSDIHVIGIKPSPGSREHQGKFNALNSLLEAHSNNMQRVIFHANPHSGRGFDSSSFKDDGIHLTEQGYRLFTYGINQACKTK